MRRRKAEEKGRGHSTLGMHRADTDEKLQEPSVVASDVPVLPVRHRSSMGMKRRLVQRLRGLIGLQVQRGIELVGLQFW